LAEPKEDIAMCYRNRYLGATFGAVLACALAFPTIDVLAAEDISEFESYMPSQAVVALWGGTGSVAVVGPNGAGKSMLLKVRAGNRGYNTPQLLQSLRICPVPGRQQTPSI
jgi:hypothetical protein